MKSPTLTDVARHAGVSYATADRVLNNRGTVTAKSAEKVQAAMSALRYVRNVAAANLSQGRRYRFVFVLPEGPNAFFQNIRHLLKARSSVTQDVEVKDVSAFDAQSLARHLLTLSETPLDGVAVVGLEAHAMAAPLEAFRKAGTPLVALISDLSDGHRAAYIGIDNVAAGRTAARLLGQAHGGRKGRVQVIVGDMGARDHHDRLAGFHSVLENDFPQLDLLPVIQSSDYGGRVETETCKLLDTTPDVTAIYNAGAGNSGLRRALGVQPNRPLVAVHELTEHARAGLEAGHFDYVIDQQPEVEIDAALTHLRALADQVPPTPIPPILPTIYVRDNLPP